MSEPTLEQVAEHIVGWRVSRVEWCGEYDGDEGLRIIFDEGRQGCITVGGHQTIDVIARGTWMDAGYLIIELG